MKTYGLLLCLLLLTCLAPAVAAAKAPPPAPVETAAVVKRPVETKLTLVGTARAHRLLTLASQVEGLVERGLVEEGQAVAVGQALLRLDDSRIALRLAEARARLREAQALWEQTRRDLRRKERLHRAKSLPLKDLQDARTQLESRRALADRAREQVGLLQKDLGDCLIRTPRAGVVVRRLVYAGEWVNRGGGVLTLAVLDPIKVVVPVPERYLSALRPGQVVTLTADALAGRRLQGRIRALIPQGDDKSRSFPVQIELANPESLIKPGMLIRATLAVGGRHQALLVPKDALVFSPGGARVVTIRRGRAQPLPVKLVAAHGDLMEVTGPLEAGMPVVVRGNERLRPGQPVRLIEK